MFIVMRIGQNKQKVFKTGFYKNTELDKIKRLVKIIKNKLLFKGKLLKF